jgi:8-oxo-dGTP diphosphatase
MFDEVGDQVVLIQKNKPSWQADCLNGLGGKIEKNESPWMAMVREYQEEAGVLTDMNHWTHYCDLIGDDYMVYVFWCKNDEYFKTSMTKESEKVCKVSISAFSCYTFVSNVRWLVHLALDENYGKPFQVTANYCKKD